MCLVKDLYGMIQSWATGLLQGGKQYMSCLGRQGGMWLHLLVQTVLELFLTSSEQNEFILGRCFVTCL